MSRSSNSDVAGSERSEGGPGCGGVRIVEQRRLEVMHQRRIVWGLPSSAADPGRQLQGGIQVDAGPDEEIILEPVDGLLREALEEGEIRDVLIELEAVLGAQTGGVGLGQRGNELNDRGLHSCLASSG